MRSMIRQNQSSIMFFYDRTTKCQTKSQTSMTIRNCCFSCIEHLKNMRLHFIRDSRTVIFHTYLCFPCFSEPPFSPTSAWISPSSTWRLTLSSAFTPGKVLVIFFISRSILANSISLPFHCSCRRLYSPPACDKFLS